MSNPATRRDLLLATLADIQGETELLEDRVREVSESVATVHSGLAVHTTSITAYLVMVNRRLSALLGLVRVIGSERGRRWHSE
ncbi:hypothetical protein [Amycolatopsis saalfeldensis]|uniref:Uncharacterized protein n=1 Tax=Amycolatopsis saalfeldensis TaxID=394193 RepID=A0A1H8YJR0_9PSEU|nr:hypothetical protein [Amycolatopsis saalfeldensis]SEP52444.1 hypothetical protein SAMN04489732_120107 [Amycolatopsis saalfeldensis]